MSYRKKKERIDIYGVYHYTEVKMGPGYTAGGAYVAYRISPFYLLTRTHRPSLCSMKTRFPLKKKFPASTTTPSAAAATGRPAGAAISTPLCGALGFPFRTLLNPNGLLSSPSTGQMKSTSANPALLNDFALSFLPLSLFMRLRSSLFGSLRKIREGCREVWGAERRCAPSL